MSTRAWKTPELDPITVLNPPARTERCTYHTGDNVATQLTTMEYVVSSRYVYVDQVSICYYLVATSMMRGDSERFGGCVWVDDTISDLSGKCNQKSSIDLTQRIAVETRVTEISHKYFAGLKRHCNCAGGTWLLRSGASIASGNHTSHLTTTGRTRYIRTCCIVVLWSILDWSARLSQQSIFLENRAE
jgi:hypothetical protein